MAAVSGFGFLGKCICLSAAFLGCECEFGRGETKMEIGKRANIHKYIEKCDTNQQKPRH